MFFGTKTITRTLVITTMRNEGPYVLEWVAHHKAIGVSDFLVFSNECDDGSDRLLDLLDAAGEITHVRHAPAGKSVQWSALRAARKHPLYEQADWVMAIDCDEFVALGDGHGSIAAALDAMGAADAVAMPWRLFGSGGVLRFEDAPVCARFTMAAPAAMVFPAAGRFFKSIYRSKSRHFGRPGIHRPKTRSSDNAAPKWRDGSGAELSAQFASNDEQIILPPTHADGRIIQLNHYSLKSAEEFVAKRRRGLPNRTSKPLDATYWAERNFNSVQDVKVQRHAEAVRNEATRFRGIAGLEAAHENCVTAHRQHIAEALLQPDEARLFTRIALLQHSTPPSPETAAELLSIMDRARSK